MTGDEPTPEELAARLEELSATVEDLRAEVRPRGPFGLPRPPTSRELARFTADYTIPAAIASLEAAVRTLELLQAALRAADTERATRERTERAGQAVLDRVDAALADLQAAIEGSGLPADPAARELLSEARRLSDETREAIEETNAAAEPTEADDDASVDVEEELETIRREVDGDGAGVDDEEDGESGGGADD